MSEQVFEYELEEAYKGLLAAIMLQAAKDYVFGTENERPQVLRDLRSRHMCSLTDDQSAIIAEQLEKHPKEIAERLRYMKGETLW